MKQPRFLASSLILLAGLAAGMPSPVLAGVPAAAVSAEMPTLAPMVKQARPAVVNIATSGKVQVQQNPLLEDPFFRQFFNMDPRQQPQEQRTQSIGSGVIVDAAKGYVLTNQHVIANADEIYVIFQDNRRVQAKLVGADKATDIAVLKIEAKNLSAIPLGDSDKIEAGDFAVAIGNPFGLGHSVSFGLISAMGRTNLGIEEYEDLIQTDAPINPGNSGGALVNLRGELIGINTAIYSQSGGNNGIGFAIPVNMARNVMNQLVEHGTIKRGVLGVQIQNLTADLADAIGTKTQEGALVSSVMENSAAAKAGIHEGDIITRLDGVPVTDAAALRNKIGLKRIGDKVTLTLLRDGKEMTARATIGEAPAEAVVKAEDLPQLAGAHFSSGVPENHPLQGKVQGVFVSDVDQGSSAWQAGLRPGDIVVSVNKQAVKTPAELTKIARASKNSLLLYIRRGPGALYIVIN